MSGTWCCGRGARTRASAARFARIFAWIGSRLPARTLPRRCLLCRRLAMCSPPSGARTARRSGVSHPNSPRARQTKSLPSLGCIPVTKQHTNHRMIESMAWMLSRSGGSLGDVKRCSRDSPEKWSRGLGLRSGESCHLCRVPRVLAACFPDYPLPLWPAQQKNIHSHRFTDEQALLRADPHPCLDLPPGALGP